MSDAAARSDGRWLWCRENAVPERTHIPWTRWHRLPWPKKPLLSSFTPIRSNSKWHCPAGFTNQKDSTGYILDFSLWLWGLKVFDRQNRGQIFFPDTAEAESKMLLCHGAKYVPNRVNDFITLVRLELDNDVTIRCLIFWNRFSGQPSCSEAVEKRLPVIFCQKRICCDNDVIDISIYFVMGQERTNWTETETNK